MVSGVHQLFSPWIEQICLCETKNEVHCCPQLPTLPLHITSSALSMLDGNDHVSGGTNSEYRELQKWDNQVQHGILDWMLDWETIAIKDSIGLYTRDNWTIY